MSRNNSITSVKSASGAKAWIVNHMKEHHRSVNAAFNAYYGSVTPDSSRDSTPAQSRKSSAVGTTPVAEAAAPAPFVHAAGNERPSYFDRAIKAAKKHHKSTNAAYQSYYGMGVHV
ncbi:uncharacterized protein B0I36DRAFT_355691 [Microdochium trichocladiopsis]|uniref:Uncharacterized protein n=1 Tax=Microdochium trichocladiopsis TaxID=1682393 RepID=A0A9P8XVG4_9PEZI|nr:uncharacterized protein B0I36DRAFT_355691 [Microdochium trichocladiopsis]KAH7014488.1 hypothetical protein B0I36DRAFT_355691 [Microdochium trichocladiopsis]